MFICRTNLSEANARLNLRTEVLYEDAVLVIFLYEIAICTLYGQSLISSPVINISEFSLGAEEYLIPYQVFTKSF